ncbi:hypothetical protein BC828DRAFT_402959 [Blastocladiella britannica]|nr:hypothetical protein BC828DRAFT_402959 [Blastocladiella britannica]
MQIHRRPPALSVTLLLALDLALHAWALSHHAALIANRAVITAIAPSVVTVLATCQSLVLVSCLVQAIPLALPVTMGWVQFAISRTAMLIAHRHRHQSSKNNGLLVRAALAHTHPDAIPAPAWRWRRGIVIAWSAVLAVKVLSLGIALYMILSPLAAVQVAAAAALYTSDPNVPGNAYDTLSAGATDTLLLLASVSACTVWAIVQSWAACRGIGRGGFWALGVSSRAEKRQ